MPKHIQTMYVVLLKHKYSAREFLMMNRCEGSTKDFIVYRTHTASWISEYVL